MRLNPKKIMCAIDFSDFSDMILSYGKSLAKEFHSKLYLCHVVPDAPLVSSHMAPYLIYAGVESERIAHAQEYLEEMAEKMDMECEIIVSTGHPADEIDRTAREQDIDMVIAATFGGSGVKRFLIGSVTSRLVKILSCPLLVLHAEGDHAQETVVEKISFERILVGCDFSEDSKMAFDYALSLAQEFQACLYLVHVVTPSEQAALDVLEEAKIREDGSFSWSQSEYLDMQKKISDLMVQKRESLAQRLERQLHDMLPEESKHWCTSETVVLEGKPYNELLSYAGEKKVDMIVLGIRGHGLLEQFLVGSTTDRVISRASCPVLAVRHTE